MKKNDELVVTCEYLSTDGKGVVKTNDGVIYVPFLLPNEKALIKVNEVKGSDVYASIKELKSSNEKRVKEKCSSYMRCGSCQLRHLDYQEQLIMKKNNVYLAFKNAGLKLGVEPTIGMIDPSNYRNKVVASFASKNKDIIYGLYEEGTHNIIGNNDCPIQDKLLNDILKSIKDLMKKNKIIPFDEKTQNGSLRHVLLRRGQKTNEVMVVFVTVSDFFPGRNELMKQLVSKHHEIKTVIQNTNPRKTSIILGDKERILYGKGYIYDDLLGINFKISPKSFFQVNPVQTERLYSEAIKLADLKKTDNVLDAYCGIGTISLAVAKTVNKVYGVEIVKEAISDAIMNAKENNIKNAVFYCDDAKKYIQNFNNPIDCLIVDPPRKGCDKEFILAIAKMKPKKIVYISCDPFSQARDIALLTSKTSYKINKVQPVDMFPYTTHVESVALLELKK